MTKFYYNSFNFQIRANNNLLFITSVCDNFCHIYKVDPFCIGKTIDDVLDQKTAEHLYSVLNYFSAHDIPLTELQELNDNFYIVKYNYNAPFIHISASQINVYDINNNYCRYISKIPKNYTDYIIAEKKKDTFIITDIKDAVSLFIGLKNRDPVSSIFLNLFHIKSCKIFDECLNSNSIMHFIDVFSNKDICKYIFITLIPLKHIKQQICIEIKIISKNTYYNYQQLYDDTSLLNKMSLKNTAAAIYSYLPVQNIFTVSEKNEMFEDILFTYENINKLTDSLLNKTLQTKRISEKKFVINDDVYTIILIPHIKMKKVLVLIFKNEDFYENYKSLLKNLTNRESTVSKYLFSGKNLKCIASELKIAPGTVKKTASNIYRKLNVESRAEFMHLFLLNEFTQI